MIVLLTVNKAELRAAYKNANAKRNPDAVAKERAGLLKWKLLPSMYDDG